MRRSSLVLAIATLIALTMPFRAVADNGAYSGSGGVFTTGSSVGANISVSGLPLGGTQATLSFSCPITYYAGGTYQLNWSCAGGSITIASPNNSPAFNGAFISGTMTMTASGGGRGGHTTYLYSFSGTLSGAVQTGAVTQASNGGFSFYVRTTKPVGTGGAPVTGAALGWNSAASPVIVADESLSRILRADNITGANLVAYGSYGSGTNNFQTIAGLAQDASKRIYISDAALNRVVRINSLSGAGWITFGTRGSGSNQFTTPRGVAIDAQGKIWVADSGNNRIVRFDDMTGTNWTAFGTQGSGTNQFSAPSSIAFDSSGRIYVADTGNNRVVRFDDLTGLNWTALTQLNIGIYAYALTSPSSIAVNSTGRIYAAIAGGNSSGYLASADDMTGTNAAISSWGAALNGISVDKSGTVYVAGTFNPGLAQVEDAVGTGYFASALGVTGLQPGAILAVPTSTPPPPDPVVSAKVLSFGNQNVGEPSGAQSVTLSNLGGTSLAISSVTSSADFPLTNNCPTTLSGGGSCVVGVTFEPTATGARRATLTVNTASVHPVLHVTIAGTGTAPNIVVLPGALTFNSQQLTTSSTAQLATLSNTGTGPLTISSITASGDFTQTNNCPGLVPAGGGCTLSVVFHPSATGLRTGSVTISDDQIPSGTSQTIALHGTGSSTAAAYTLSAGELLFPNQQINTTSAGQSVTLKNNSSAAVTVTAPVYPARFKGTTTCGASLAKGASCQFTVQFVPTAVGPVSATVSIVLGGQPTLTLSLSGTGVSSGALSALSINPNPLDFGLQVLGDSITQSVVITNAAGVPDGIQTSFSGPTVFTINSNNCPSILMSGASCTIQLTFQSNTIGTFNATLTVKESSGAITRVPVTGSAAMDNGG